MSIDDMRSALKLFLDLTSVPLQSQEQQEVQVKLQILSRNPDIVSVYDSRQFMVLIVLSCSASG